MEKKIILYIGGFELPDKNAAAHRVLNNSKVFQDLGYSVVLFGVNKQALLSSQIKLSNRVMNFETWTRSYPKSFFEWLRYLTTIKFMNFFTNKYTNIEIIIAYNFPSVALSFLNKFCKKNNIKLIADCTEWYSTKNQNIIYKLLKGFDSFYRMRIVHKKIDGLIVISKYLEKYYSKCNNLIRIPPLVDLNDNKWKHNLDLNKEFQIKDDGLVFVYAGNPGVNKDDIKILIHAFFKLYKFNFYLVIIGVEKEHFLNKNPTIIDELNYLHEKVFFPGQLLHQECISWLKFADYSIFFRERSRVTLAGFPTKFVESITCSTPVITSDSSDLKEYLSDSAYGLLSPDYTIDSLTDLLESVLNNSSDINTNYINNNLFHYTNYISKFENFLNKIKNY
ncbi:glycosyltransferase [Spirochaeta dissipatitropha]